MSKKLSLADQILDYHLNLPRSLELPGEVEILYPYGGQQTKRVMKDYYQSYYNDNEPRVSIWGINPGRFGAGVTGIPFTDPIFLETVCGVNNSFDKRHELSSQYVYELVDVTGGPPAFFGTYYITSVCPLGFLREGKNYNYYDDKKLEEALEGFILEHIEAQLNLGIRTDFAICWGKGKNAKYMHRLNEKYQFFDRILEVPHPRWIMQYRRKKKDLYVDAFIQLTSRLRDSQ